jgi:hypothetical protein
MTPAVDNIVIQQGGTFSRRYRFKDGTGAPLNMIGYSVSAQVWTQLKTAKLADFTVTWNNQALGDFTISLTPSTTRELDKSAFWDLLVTNPNQTKDYWVRGRATLDVGYTE